MMETTVATPSSPQPPNISSPKAQSPKKHYMRTFSNSNLNNQSPRQQGYKRDGRNHRQNRYQNQNQIYKSYNRTENEQNENNGGKSEGRGHVNNSQAMNGCWRRTQEQIVAENKRKVIVTGYPTYTNIQEIVKLLSKFGDVKVDRCNKIVTVLVYGSEAEAQKALSASDQIVVYGKFLKIKKFTNEKHVDDMSRSARRTKNTVQDDIILPQEIDLSGDFYQQVNNIEAAIRLTAEEIQDISTLYRDVEAVLQPLYPGCKAIPFGSITTGLGIKTSDADCFVEMPARFQSPGHDVRFVGAARRLLAAQPALFADVLAIPGANTPIVKFRHLPTATRCDLNCKTPLGALNSRLVAALLAHDARLPPLALLLKYWARVHRLSGTGRLTNYALVLLLVFYLQARRVLPPVRDLQAPRAAVPPRPVDHWDAAFAPAALPPPADDTPLPHLLGGFFQFYAEFAFERAVVCPYLGVAVPKAAFEGGGAPPGLERYAGNVARGLAGPLRHASPLCVQDPLEQSHNVASGVSATLAGELRAHLLHAAARYRAALPACRALLPGVLQSAPPRRLPQHTARVRLAPRTVRALPADWRPLLRHLLLDRVFAEMLALPLTRVPVDPPEPSTLRADSDNISTPDSKTNFETKVSPSKTAAVEKSEAEATVNSETRTSKTEFETEAGAGPATKDTCAKEALSASVANTLAERKDEKAASGLKATLDLETPSSLEVTSSAETTSDPGASSDLVVAFNPEATSGPAAPLNPESTSVSELISNPKVTPDIEAISGSKVTPGSEATSDPKATPNLETTSVSEVTSNPKETPRLEAISCPKATSNPETTSVSEVTSNPEATSKHEAILCPEATSGFSPKATSNLETTSVSEVTSNPEATSRVEDTSGPKTPSSSEAVSSPKLTSSSEVTSEAKVEVTSETKETADGETRSTAEVKVNGTELKTKGAKGSPSKKGMKAEGEKVEKVEKATKGPRARGPVEVYTCVATRVTWERRRPCEPLRELPAELLARERAAAQRLLAAGPELVDPLHLLFELTLTEEPRSAVLLARPLTGDLASFRTLATFLHSWLHSWLVVLLQPHVAPPAPAPAPPPPHPPPQPDN